MHPRIVCLALSALVGGGGCKAGTPTSSGSPPAPTLAVIQVVPAMISLETGQTVQFQSYGRDDQGDSVSVAPLWSASAGSITNSGLYTAGSVPGAYRVMAAQNGVADTASVTVTQPGATRTDLTLAPAAATLAPGASQAFTATFHWSDGSSGPGGALFSATGGSISPAGLYLAGGAAGNYRVIASDSSGALSDTSAVTIQPVTTGPSSDCSSPQPQWIWCDDFEQDRLSSYFEYVSAGGSFTRVAGVGYQGSYGMRARFAAGQTSAGALHLAFGLTPQSYFRPVDSGTAKYRELYWRVYVRNQPGWVGGGGDKLTRAIAFASSTSWAEAMKAPVWSGGSAPKYNYLVLDPISGTDTAGNLKSTKYNDFANERYLGAVQSVTPLFDSAHVGQWYCVEARARLNDPGQSNGEFQLWINGTLEAQHLGMNWVGSFTAYGMNAVFVENYWNNGSPVAQERYIDDFVVSTSRIGC